jgi:ABC-type branched-subunit amino acid transport system ATPase component
VDEMVGLLRRLHGGAMSAIVVDQRLDTVFDTCEQVHVMTRGQFAASGTSVEVQRDDALLAQHLGV